MTDPILPAAGGPYRDDDLVYVDPELRVVVGRVEWSNTGKPKPKVRPSAFSDADDDAAPAAPAAAPATGAPAPAAAKPAFRRRPPRVRYYPWGTYRSMKRLFKLEGKVIEERGNATLDQVLPKALTEAFWDLDKPGVPPAAGSVEQSVEADNHA